MGLFNKKWEPKQVSAPDQQQFEAIHVMSMYKNDEGMTGSEIAMKYAADNLYCDFTIDKSGVYLVDNKGKTHHVGYLSDSSKAIMKKVNKMDLKYKAMRLNCIGNVDIIYY